LKLGIMADSHENMPLIAKAVELFNCEEVDLVLHAGDFISPITAKEFGNLKARLVGVFGNNDGDKLFLQRRFRDIGELYEDYHELEVEGKKIILMHQPKLLKALIASGEYDLIIYGHTHQIDIQEGRPLVVNPGECGGWLTGRSTVAVVDLETLKAKVYDL
jgi:putative phosphoesterase